MNPKLVARMLVAGVMAAALLVIAAPAFAQMGTLRGKVVDEAGKPVPDADLTFDYIGELSSQFTGKTDGRGEWIRAGLQTRGRWTITAKKGDLQGRAVEIAVPPGTPGIVPDIVIRRGALPPATAAEIAAAKAKNDAIVKITNEVNAALTANNFDLALTKLDEAAKTIENCAVCYAKKGDVYLKKNDEAAAEAAYKEAIKVDANAPEAYSALSSLYNKQRKFAEAGEMNAKAASLSGGATGGGGGGTAQSEFNAGAIAFNGGKIPEAKQHFANAIKLDPNMAEAHFQYAMVLINQGNIAEAKGSLETYLKLSPSGTNAPMAKTILDTMK